ncbi:MAG: beta strand repeat-containing protein, partial [Sphingomonadaceae bacterium]
MNVKQRNYFIPTQAAADCGVQLRRKLLAVLVAACYGSAMAAPLAPQVVAGQATFNQQGKLFSITNTPNTIINWQSFSVNADEVTRFIQQSSDSKVLNRITGQDPSQILGALQSNGKVFLINPNGVLFGKDARVDVQGLVASSLGLSNADFLAGKNNFSAGAVAGKVSNQGTLSTPAGGQVFLLAPTVENIGLINAPNGDVLLAAGQSVQLLDSANPEVRVLVSAPADAALNLGQVVAQGGRIGIYGALVNQRGTLNANSAVRGENGQIILRASGTTLLEAGSRTSATNTAAGASGGRVEVLGQQVGLTGDALVDVSGAGGGGTVLVGGDYRGQNPALPNAQQSYVGPAAVIRADASEHGNGGKVIVWSDRATRVHGALSARGGGQGGDGGLVETSGHYLDLQGSVDTRAPQGRNGTLLLDPSDVYIASDSYAASAAGMQGANLLAPVSGVFMDLGNHTDSLLLSSTLQATLATSNVTVLTDQAAGPNQGSGFIKVVSPISWSSNQSLTLNAASNIYLNAAVDGAHAALHLNAGGSIVQVTSPVDALTVASLGAIAAGSITLDNASNVLTQSSAPVGATLVANGGNVTLTAVHAYLGDSSVAGNLSVTGANGGVTINGNVAVQGNLNASALNGNVSLGGSVSAGGSASLTTASGNILLGGTLGSGTNLTLAASGAGASISASGASALSSSAGDIRLTADNMTLGGSITGAGVGHSVWLAPSSSSQQIALGQGATDGGSTLGLNQSELQGINVGSNGLLQIGLSNSDYGGGITVSGALDLSATLGGGLLLQTYSGDIAIGSGMALTVPGIVSLQTSPSGNARFSNSGAVSAGSGINVFAGKVSLAEGTLQAPSVSLESLNNIDLGASSDSVGVMAISAADVASIHTGNGNAGSLSVSVNSGNSDGSIAISQPLVVAGGLRLFAPASLGATASVNVGGTFMLAGGNWTQLGALPAFEAYDFAVIGGSFLRAAGGDGSLSTPYLLTDVFGLQGAGSLPVWAAYQLQNNIDASGTAHWSQGFNPLGGSYTGVFDGNHLAIQGLHINRSSSDDVGLFATLATGTIRNLTLSGAVISGRNRVGALYGNSSAGGLVEQVQVDASVTGVSDVGGMSGRNLATVSSVSSSGSVTGNAGANGSNIGGLVGVNLGSISHAGSASSVSSSGYGYTGGLVGSNQTNANGSAAIDHSYATGNVTASGEIIGGLVGDNNGGSISVAYATGNVNGGRNVGGLAGRNAAGGSMANVYASGHVSGNTDDYNYSHSNMGGLLGDLNSGTVQNSFSSGSVDGSAFGDGVYGMVGAQEGGTLVHGYFNGDTAGYSSGGRGTPLSAVATRSIDSFSGFDISVQGAADSSSVWRIYDGYTIPLLRDFLTPATLTVSGGSSVTKVYDGSGAAFGGTLVSAMPANVQGTLAFAGPFNVGTHAIGGLYSSVYDLSYTGSSAQLTITPRTLDVSVSVAGKTYDGLTTASAPQFSLLGVVNGDAVIVGATSVSFADKTVGASKSLLITGSQLSNDPHGNYLLGSVSGSGVITAAPLQISGLG